MTLDQAACYRAVDSKDPRFDGVFYTGVHTTGIYCRPSCPARTPLPANVSFYRSAAAAQSAGFRACKRCRPDASPGSPAWNVAGDVAGRAMRLICDGVVDRDGVHGLASRLGYTSRHLARVLTAELGAPPLALARSRRAQTARILIETTDLNFADVAFASGFSSVRQFNDTVAEVYACSPRELRRARASRGQSTPLQRSDDGWLRLRLAVRTPFAGAALLGFLAARAVQGVEAVDGSVYTRSLRLPHGSGVVTLRLEDMPEPNSTGFVEAAFLLEDLRDTSAAIERSRRLIDADADPAAVTRDLGSDPVLGALVRRSPGLRVPGHVDGFELAVRAVLGQQISVERARRLAGDLVERFGDPLERGLSEVTHLFPTPSALAGVDPSSLGMPRARGTALRDLSTLCAEEAAPELSPAGDRDLLRERLLAVRGIGPWTVGYIAMRATSDPDVFLPTDVGVKNALKRLGINHSQNGDEPAEHWKPWRSYALMHLWHILAEPRDLSTATITNEET